MSVASDGQLTSPRKRQILSQAAQLFAKRGYEATSIAEVGDAVGLGRGALYHHISSKEQLLYEISRERPVEMVAFGRALLAEDVDAEEKLRRLSRKMMETLASNLAGATVFLADSRSLSGAHHREIVQLRTEFEAIWNAILAQGVQEGRFRDTHPLITKGILGFLNYSYVWFRPRGELTPVEIADLFSDFILQALAAEPRPSTR